MTTPTVEVAVGIAPDTVPTSGDWVDVTDRLTMPLRCRVGGNAFCEFTLDDDDGQLAPSVVGDVLMSHLRVTVDGTPLWWGFVQRWKPAWRYNQSLRQVRGIDGLAWLATTPVVDVDLPRQRSLARLGAILDLAGWPAASRDLTADADGGIMLTETVEERANLRQLLEDVADAEDSWLWFSAAGEFAFRDRKHQLAKTADLTVAGEGASGDVGAVNRVDTSYDTDQVFTVGTVELADGTSYTRKADAASKYERELTVRDKPLPGYQAEGLASWIVNRFGTPTTWLDRLPVNTLDDVAAVLAIEPSSRVDFTHEVAEGSDETLSGMVSTVDHEVEPGRFVTTFELAPWFGEGPWLTLGDPVFGKIGATAGNKVGP